MFKLSEYFVSYLIKRNVLKKDDIELYQYGFFLLFSKILYLTVTIVVGLVFNIIFESLIFFILFYYIRQYAGGYHASKEIICNILTSVSILFCILVIKDSIIHDLQIPLLIISLISSGIVFIICPLDTPEKPLTDYEFHYYRKISWIILLIISVLIIISFIFEWKFLFAPSCLSLILESILLIAGKVKKVYQLKNAE
jgi:accessory gene regulator B